MIWDRAQRRQIGALLHASRIARQLVLKPLETDSFSSALSRGR